MNTQPQSELTVVIPHYGDPDPALAVVRDLQAQTGCPRLQIVVSDDASPEPFPDIAGVEVVRRERNGGFGQAANSGAVLARGELLLICNSDVLMGPTFIRDLLDAARPWMPAVVSPWVTDIDGEYQWVGRAFPRTHHHVVEWLTPLARWRSRRAWHVGVGHDVTVRAGEDLPVDWVVGACMLLPTFDFRRVGGFDGTFYMNSEEVDLQRRLRGAGVPSIVAGSVPLAHIGAGSTDPQRGRQWLVDGRFLYARKWGGERRLRISLVVASFLNAAVNTTRQARGVDVHTITRLRDELRLVRMARLR